MLINMAIPLWPDWNKLYDEYKCLDRGVPFTDEQQNELFKLKWQPNEKELREKLVIKWRAKHEAKKLDDPLQVQAQANADAIQEKLWEIVNKPKEDTKPSKNTEKTEKIGKADNSDTTDTQNSDNSDSGDTQNSDNSETTETDEPQEPQEPQVVDISKLSYNELKALAKERGIDLGSNPKKDDLIKALQEKGE